MYQGQHGMYDKRIEHRPEAVAGNGSSKDVGVLSGSTGNSVLVVDDEPLARDAIAETLRDEGFTVLTASDGRSAIDLINERHPAVILTDLDMPIQGGVEVVRHARAHAPDAAVYVFSSHTGLSIEREIVRSGAAGFLVKPIDLDDVVDRVREAMARRRTK